MARLALEQALPAWWIDEMFDAHRQRQYPRELLFSTVVELMTLVTLGLRPSLHAAARKMPELGVFADGALRQGQPHRTGDPACAGAGQRQAPCADDG